MKHDYKCDKCNKPANYNLQGGGWALWNLNHKKYPDFESAKIWGFGEGDENEFFCEECAEKEGII
jgi:hypothetical protein